MADKYSNFQKLNLEERSGVDFRIDCRPRPRSVAIIAPHGGKIEPRTSEIAAAIADDIYNLYCFEGIKPRKNRELHITSCRFDEPQCVDLLSTCDRVVAVHGCKGKEHVIYVGGLDRTLRDAIQNRLDAVDFKTDEHPHFQGTHSKNICNRGRSGRGVQLEISLSLRLALAVAGSTVESPTLAALVGAVRGAIEDFPD